MDELAERRERKKLEEAAAFWARGGKHGGPTAEDDLALFGVPRETAAAWIGDKDENEEHFEVLPENWEALQIFLMMGTQWRVAIGMSGAAFTGLDHTALWANLNGLCPPEARPDLFAGVCVMERAALPLMNKRSKDE